MDKRELLEEYIRRQQLRKTAQKRAWCPQSPTAKQQEFLGRTEFEVLFGGAAGPGKSSALLMAALEHVDTPGYAALLLRRTYADLALPGAIMDRAESWLQGSGANWNGTDKKWTFPSGAVLQFGYLEDEKDKYRYQSAEFQFVGFDELTQFSETQYKYMLSRVRRTRDSSIPLRVRSASNPGGVGHDWVFKRFVDPKSRDVDAVFIPARMGDNPHLDVEEYRRALSKLDSATRRQLEEGAWIRDTQGLIYKYDDARNGADSPPSGYWEYVLGIDLGASESKPTTAFTVWAYSYTKPHEIWTIESSKHAAMIPSTVAERIQEYQSQYDTAHMVCDAGALGKGYVEEFRQRYNLAVEPARKADKLGYRKLMNGDFERGVIRVVRATCESLIEEWNTVSWDEKGLDAEKGAVTHESDAALYAWREARHWLAQVPDVVPPQGSSARSEWEIKRMEEELQRQHENPRPWYGR